MDISTFRGYDHSKIRKEIVTMREERKDLEKFQLIVGVGIKKIMLIKRSIGRNKNSGDRIRGWVRKEIEEEDSWPTVESRKRIL